MRKLISAAVFSLVSLAASNCWANIITNGDFQSAGPTPASEFMIASVLNGGWRSAGYSWGGPVAGDRFAKSETGGNGGDWRLVQFIDAAASGITAGSKLQLNFDYIYDLDPLANTQIPRGVYLIGISANRNYQMYQGAGPDGTYGNGDTAVFDPPDKLLASMSLNVTSTWLRDQILMANIGANYYAIAVVFQTSCYGPPGGSTGAYCNYDRGIDNVSLSKVPEPGTLALLGLGLAGLGLSRRRKH